MTLKPSRGGIGIRLKTASVIFTKTIVPKKSPNKLAILNFENGLGYVSLTVHWQQVVRGAFLLIVVIIQASITKEKIIS